MGGTNPGGKDDDRFVVIPSASLQWCIGALERQEDQEEIFGSHSAMTAERK